MNNTALFIYPEQVIEIVNDFANGWGNWVPDLDSKYTRNENNQVILNVTQNNNILTYPTTSFVHGKTYKLTYTISNAKADATHFITIDNSNSIINTGNGTFTTNIVNVKSTLNNLRVVLQNNCLRYQTISDIQAINIEEQEIELYDNNTIPLNLSIADVSDFTKRDTGYSLSVTIPGTQLNNIVFKTAYKVQADNTFKLNYPVRARLYQKGFQIFDGSLYLDAINLSNEDRKIEYRTYLRSSINTLFKITSERYLRNGLPEERTEYFYDNAHATWNFNYVAFLVPAYPTGFKVGALIRVKQNAGALVPAYDGVWTIKDLTRVTVNGVIYDSVGTDCPVVSDTPVNGGIITNVIETDTYSSMAEFELDFSEYNHQLTYDNVVNSWYKGSSILAGTPNPPQWQPINNELGKGYVYPLIDYGFNNTDLNVRDLKPSLFIKEILDKILKNAGFTYTSTFLNSDFFKRLLYANTTEFITEYTVTEAASRTSTSSNQVSLNDTTTGKQTIFHKIGIKNPEFTTPLQVPLWNTDGVNGYVPINYSAKYTITCDINSNALKFNICRAKGWKGGGSDDDKVKIYNTADEPSGANTVGTIYFDLIHIKANGSELLIDTKILNVKKLPNYLTLPEYPLQKVFNMNDTGTISFDPITNYVMSVGDRLEVRISMSSRHFADTNIHWNWIKDAAVFNSDLNANVSFVMGPKCVNLKVVADTGASLFEGDSVKINNTLHKGITQSDFILSLVKMFNLYIDIDPLNPKKLIIEPYNVFTSTGEVIDWSQKRHFDRDFLIQPASDILRKNIKFSYLPDTDELNASFSLNTANKIYGEKYILSDVKTTEEYDVTKGIIFAPTVNDDFVGKKNLIIAPVIRTLAKEASSVTYKPRILYWGGIQYWDNNKTTQWSMQTMSTKTNFTYYPYAGHVDKPLRGEDSLDLNFGMMPGYYWDFDSKGINQNNLVNVYYKNMLTELTDESARKVTAWIWLTEKDISEFSFKNSYIIDGVHYRVNRIIDYTSGDIVTKVELLKLFKNPIKVKSSGSWYGWDRWNRDDITFGDYRHFEEDAFINPHWNNDIYTDWFPSKNEWIIGGGNTLMNRVNKVRIKGDDNIIGVGSSNITIENGNRIYVRENLTNVSVINSNNLIINESDVSYINGQRFKDGLIERRVDLIKGGEDELQDMYSPINVNFVSGGVDEVRGFGSTDFNNANTINSNVRNIRTKSLYE